jgi:hypothetical protein
VDTFGKKSEARDHYVGNDHEYDGAHVEHVGREGIMRTTSVGKESVLLTCGLVVGRTIGLTYDSVGVGGAVSRADARGTQRLALCTP